MNNKTSHSTHLFIYTFFFLLVGISLRLIIYLYNRPLWLDESFLALNIVNRPLLSLFKPLDYNQGAPLGFLFIVKLFTDIFGTSEFSLRLLPLIFGIASLIYFYFLAKKTLAPHVVPIAVGLFALSYPLIYYSSEIKQYSADVFAAVILFLIAFRLRERRLSYINISIYSLTGAILIWLSHPAIFILFAIALCILGEDIFNKSWNHFYICMAIFSIWAISFGSSYYVALSKLAKSNYLISYWSGYYFGLPLFSKDNFRILLSNIFYIFDDPRWIMWRELRSLLFIPFIVGAIQIWAKEKNKLFILMLPIILVMIASFFHKYPFAIRLILFLSPAIILVTAQGLGNICEYLERRRAIWGILFISLVFLFFVWRDASYILRPDYREDIRSVLNFIITNFNEREDDVYLYNCSRYAYKYYKNNYNLPEHKVMIGTALDDNGFQRIPINFNKDLEKISSHNKVWIVFSHINENDKINILNKIKLYGKIINQHEAEGSSTYLFQFD